MTDKIHFDDLTQIHTPFGLLDEDTQTRLKACKRVQVFDGKWDYCFLPVFYTYQTYRQAPDPDRPIDVDWHALGRGVYCVARDANGKVYAYNGKPVPVPYSTTWTLNDSRCWRIDGLALLRDPGTMPWDQSLVINPLWEGKE